MASEPTQELIKIGSFHLQNSMASREGTTAQLPSTANTDNARTSGSSLVPSIRIVPEIEWSEDVETVSLSTQKEESPHLALHGMGEASKGGGVFLTWEDLWVTVSSWKTGVRVILEGLTGYAQPGEILTIMGPSGCGKSTLLDALAGRLRSNTRQSGEILINGQKQMLAFGTSAYVTQDDTLMTTLTVREAINYSAHLQLPDSMPKFEKTARAEMTIKEMGLQDAIDTRIGGLSGGEKRRVSICIHILTHPKLLFLDEPTSGLDSAASYHIMRQIVHLAQQGGRTVIAAIHQPSSDVFELFHNLCLLSCGRTVYFGPASSTNEFFAVNGFPCPSLRNPSDHYLRTINKDFDQDMEQVPDSLSTIEVINILVESYKSSSTYWQVTRDIAEKHKMVGGGLEKGKQASFLTQWLVLTRRSSVNMYRDLGYYWLRLAIFICFSVSMGTVYRDTTNKYEAIQAKSSMLMFEATFLTFMSIGGYPSLVEEMKIFGQERLNGHYGVGAFVVGNLLSSLPYLLLISLVPGAIAYYLGGLGKGIDRFVYYVIVLLVCTMLVESLMMIVASIIPNFLMGLISGAGIIGMMILNCGFFRARDNIPKPIWRYPIHYISFQKYANQGLCKNEFIGETFLTKISGGSPITGREILISILRIEMGYSKWVDLAILFGMVILYKLIFLGILKSTEKFKPIVRSLQTFPIELKQTSNEGNTI